MDGKRGFIPRKRLAKGFGERPPIPGGVMPRAEALKFNEERKQGKIMGSSPVFRRPDRVHVRKAQPHVRKAQPHVRKAQPHVRKAQPHVRKAQPHVRRPETLKVMQRESVELINGDIVITGVKDISPETVKKAIVSQINCNTIKTAKTVTQDGEHVWSWKVPGATYMTKGGFGTIFKTCVVSNGKRSCMYIVKLEPCCPPGESFERYEGCVPTERGEKDSSYNVRMQAFIQNELSGYGWAPRVYDSGWCPDGTCITIMDRARGAPFKTLLEKSAKSEEDENRAMKAVDALFRDLTTVHELGYQHGDLNPGNFFYNAKDDKTIFIDVGVPVKGRPAYHDFLTLIYYIDTFADYVPDKVEETILLEARMNIVEKEDSIGRKLTAEERKQIRDDVERDAADVSEKVVSTMLERVMQYAKDTDDYHYLYVLYNNQKYVPNTGLLGFGATVKPTHEIIQDIKNALNDDGIDYYREFTKVFSHIAS